MRRIALAVAIVWCAAQAGDAAPPVVSLHHPPGVISDRDVLPYEVWVPPQPEPRLLLLAAYDGDDERLSGVHELNARSAPIQVFPKWRLPAGDLELVAALFLCPCRVTNEGVKAVRLLGKDHRTILVRDPLNPDF